MKKVFKIFAITLGILALIVAGLAAYVKIALPNVGPAPELTAPSTPDRIERGKYLANHVMICMDCHSTRNWNEFSGPLFPGTLGKGGEIFDRKMGFPGEYHAANITPSGIKDWTDGEIFRAITTGVRKNGKPIFPVMPYPNYSQLDKEDVLSIIAYIRSLAPIDNTVAESSSDFPMNFIINTIPVKAALTTRPSPENRIAYGKYIVNAAACNNCHTPFEKGQSVESLSFAGGRSFPMPAGTITSANLTPDNETGIGTWTREIFISKFSAYRDSAAAHRAVDFMKEYNTVMPWIMYSGMTDDDLSAIYEFLKSLSPIKQKIVKFVPNKS